LGGEPLRRRLFVLAVAAIVPLAATSGIALLVLAQQQEAQAERAGIEITRALSTAVDAELARSISVLEGLAVGPALDAGELRRYHEVMRRALETRPDWVTMTLADPSGRQLLNARASFGRKLGRLVEPASFEQAVRARRAIVGALAKGPGGEYGVPVRVPVVRGGSVRYVLTAAVRPEVILEVLNRQRLPQDWVVSVFDASGSRVARSRQHAQFIDQPPSPSLLELMRRAGRRPDLHRVQPLGGDRMDGGDRHPALGRGGGRAALARGLRRRAAAVDGARRAGGPRGRAPHHRADGLAAQRGAGARPAPDGDAARHFDPGDP
jgi:hypothetical protein